MFAVCGSSNRTFMELKYVMSILVYIHVFSSNRTFMELKSVDEIIENPDLKVLIVPLWN